MREWGLLLDNKVLFFFLSFRTPFLNRVFYFLTWLGNGWVAFPLGLLVLLFKKSKKKVIKGGGILFLSLLLSSIVLHILKEGINRPRPLSLYPQIEVIGPPLKRASFPSGHSQVAFCVATVLVFFFPEWRLRFVIYILAGLVGISRIYLGVHFPSDVLAGGILGYAGGKGGIFLSKKIWREYEEGNN